MVWSIDLVFSVVIILIDSMRNLKAAFILIIALIFLVIVLPGCSTTPIEPPSRKASNQDGPMPTVRIIPTLYPTATKPPKVEPTNTRPQEPIEVTSTPINFEQVVVDIRYAIPAISMDRRIVGNVSSRIEVIDQVSGESIVIPNQPGILLELQQVLEQIELEELPDECSMCVTVEYSLPMADKEGTGWLQDVQLLASLENYTTVQLGSHFPPGTIFGLRQSATPYQVAHTVALTDDGQLWRWVATDAQVTMEPTDLLLNLLGDVPERQILDSLLTPERVNCPVGPGFETLYIATEDDVFLHDFTCPEFTLASSLIPLYSTLDQLADESMIEAEVPEPEPTLPLDTVVNYKQLDGTTLTLFRDGLAVVRTTDGITRTAILTGSAVLSATTTLIESDLLLPGAGGLFSEEETNVLFVRGQLGVYSVGWLEEESQGMEIVIRQLESLKEQIYSLAFDLESEANEPNGDPIPTPNVE